MREDIVGGLKNAIAKGEPLEKAMRSFVNAGYDPIKVKQSAIAILKEKEAAQQNALAQQSQPTPVSMQKTPPAQLPQMPPKKIPTQQGEKVSSVLQQRISPSLPVTPVQKSTPQYTAPQKSFLPQSRTPQAVPPQIAPQQHPMRNEMVSRKPFPKPQRQRNLFLLIFLIILLLLLIAGAVIIIIYGKDFLTPLLGSPSIE